MEQVVVTGGGGFIGQGIVRALVARGCLVTVVGRRPYPELESLGVECCRGDIADAAFLREVCAGKDTVFHVAAKAGVWGKRSDYVATNVQGSRNVLAACLDQGVRALVYTSTPSVVFDRTDIEGGDEQLPYSRRPLCPYAATKIIAEQELLAADGTRLRTTAIRPHLVWGPGDRNLIPRLVERGRKGQLKIVGQGTNRVDISYIDNVVHAHLLAGENLHGEASAGGEAFFIGQDEPVLLWEWINSLFARIGVEPVTARVPFQAAYLAGAVSELLYGLCRVRREPKMTRFVAHQLAHSHWFDHGKARAILGYEQQVSSEEGLSRLTAWLSEQEG
ncbi:NAD-dependent epimerase/dehydratase family protein [Desulfogranum mediterraneum]|uniref:NAD-dependent epimerase/dehydratase family protein n=1 Tax=Desulfogranum mediterraneum TaxID=160661 RepID=UPI0003FD19B6|nr:NAD-dependent epimerase/dehydratase family protein [Desulfogranum mediterraneum]